ncbi:hypothetical protein EGR_09535 [Echinococcus granulosus]|uniref:Uncharacterized protein n=1 Tax=Echinococcus granulosus TaxID=6210 RepID=W6U3A9_ECHGR|nr:hypothetical protein EGR_09535 [Echinococcus granulosus]EUB55595.1 hypothetical protein EGR_09535 [Echinococcus granulosus]
MDILPLPSVLRFVAKNALATVRDKAELASTSTMLAVLTEEKISKDIKGTEPLTALHDSCMMRKLNRFSLFASCFRHGLHYFTSVNWDLRDFLTPASSFDFRSGRKGCAMVGPSSGLEDRANVVTQKLKSTL